jgi:lipoate-protein ligase B
MQFQDWGLIDYSEALVRQQTLIEQLAFLKKQDQASLRTPDGFELRKPAPGLLVFCNHPAVVTVGRKTQPQDIFAWTGPIVEVSRGGRATYHGPSQVVAYPLFDLEKINTKPDVVGFLRTLEQIVVETLKHYGLQGRGKISEQSKAPVSEDVNLEDTGVWLGDRKIASLGIAVKHWISFHGIAINLKKDSSAFQGLNPCGYSPQTMTSLEEVTEQLVDIEDFKDKLRAEFKRQLSVS